MSLLILIWIVWAQKESVKVLEEICFDMDLVDIWRISPTGNLILT